jgi:hypothetical protein
VYATKDKVRVTVIMDAYRIEGDIHILVGSRLTDALNSKAKDFFAITNAKVYRVTGDEVMWETEYLAVNRESIACLFPLEDGL